MSASNIFQKKNFFLPSFYLFSIHFVSLHHLALLAKPTIEVRMRPTKVKPSASQTLQFPIFKSAKLSLVQLLLWLHLQCCRNHHRRIRRRHHLHHRRCCSCHNRWSRWCCSCDPAVNDAGVAASKGNGNVSNFIIAAAVG